MTEKKNSSEAVQKLREVTGAGVMDCYRALQEAHDDFDKAVNIVREKGFSKAEKRADRETGAGMIHSYLHNGRIGVLVNLRAETDFVVRSDPFQELAHELVMQIAATSPKDVEALLAEPYIKDESRTVQDIVNDVIAKTGEKVAIKEFSRLEA
jgi:elongation factor Ts